MLSLEIRLMGTRSQISAISAISAGLKTHSFTLYNFGLAEIAETISPPPFWNS